MIKLRHLKWERKRERERDRERQRETERDRERQRGGGWGEESTGYVSLSKVQQRPNIECDLQGRQKVLHVGLKCVLKC